MAAETAIILGSAAFTAIMAYIAINTREETISWPGRLTILIFTFFSAILLINATAEIAIANGYAQIGGSFAAARTGLIYLTILIIFFYMFMKLLGKALDVPNFTGKIGKKLKW